MTSRSPLRARQRTLPEGSFLDRLIDPIDRLSETIFSILILLIYTMAFRFIQIDTIQSVGDNELAAAAGDINELLIGAIGAIVAWGAIDGILYALLSMFARGESHRLLYRIQDAESEQEAVQAIAENLDYLLEPISDENERQKLYAGVLVHLRDSQPRQIGFTRDDLTGALGHVLVAIIAALPSLAPLMVFRQDALLAIRVSNIISFCVLFYAGYNWGKYTGANPWKTGLLLTSVAMAMILIAILLGG